MSLPPPHILFFFLGGGERGAYTLFAPLCINSHHWLWSGVSATGRCGCDHDNGLQSLVLHQRRPHTVSASSNHSALGTEVLEGLSADVVCQLPTIGRRPPGVEQLPSQDLGVAIPVSFYWVRLRCPARRPGKELHNSCTLRNFKKHHCREVNGCLKRRPIPTSRFSGRLPLPLLSLGRCTRVVHCIAFGSKFHGRVGLRWEWLPWQVSERH